ncbi:DUF4249 domain-containing protein [Hymenobacter jeollabukensis]|uniref:DUF4249 domain-containing protein n=1 Tax=Hymenobacter jeollabukensis TaxID=2025313 RepID=A0A5R8WR17_9BACT|nr:DUF4249 domain-containing protein [Hymenobacter jeollabukensis]TLM93136.1 DUF4249 domain-containing protein [Hymenobacter jeollabukensis]
MTFIQSDFLRETRPAALLLPALLAACDTAIDVPEPEHTPRVAMVLTLDNLAATDSVMRQNYLGRLPFVSVSQRLYDLTPLQGRTDATVEVRDAAGAVVERYRPIAAAPSPYPGGGYYNQGQYRPTLRYQFRPGQTYRVRTTVPGIEPAESQLTLPAPVAVDVTKTPLSSNSGQTRARVTVAFDEPGGSNDYYLVTAQVVDASGQRTGYLNLSDEDDTGVAVPTYRLSDPRSSYELYPFSDANVNGQRLSFSANVTFYSGSGQPNPPAQYLQVTLTHLTRDLYLFYNSYVQYSNNDGNPFAEPTPLYSNVAPGFGIFGGATDTWVRLPL